MIQRWSNYLINNMCTISEDILVPISGENLPKLAKMYEKHTDWFPNAYSTILNGIEWQQKVGKESLIIFLSPNNCWKEDGTFFAIMQYPSPHVFIFTLDKTCKNVRNGLLKTNRLDYKEETLFYAIHEHLFPTLDELIKEKQLKLIYNNLTYMYTISKDVAINFDVQLPPDVYLDELDKSMVPRINLIWPFRSPISTQFLTVLIEMNGGYGLFLKDNNELVAWILFTPMGQLGILQTLEEHKRKGYASLVTMAASKHLAEKGINPMGTVMYNNTASLGFFGKMGFKSVGKCQFRCVHCLMDTEDSSKDPI